MRIRSALVLCAMTGVGVLSTACDAIATYTIDNQTDQPLITRGVMEEDCSQTGGYGSDYLEEWSVPPNTTVDVEYVYGAAIDSMSCIQVLTSDRQLVLAERYHEDRTYTVDSIPPGDVVAADPETLPEHGDFGQLTEDLLERPVPTIAILGGMLFVLLLMLAIPLGTLIAFLVIGRDIYRRYVKKSHA